MQIQKVTVEYDEATYIAEGKDAVSWREWMLQAEEYARKNSLWVWDSWTRIGERLGPTAPAGPGEPSQMA